MVGALLSFPGVHRPTSDTWLLRDAMCDEPLAGAKLADLCTGSGALAVAAARAGAASVLAVDVSLRSTLAARLNAALNGCRLRVRRGDLIGALGEERFDVIVSNPPYVPALTDALRAAMTKETELFFTDIAQQDRSVLEFLDADHTFVNSRLAKLYGIQGVEGDDFRRVVKGAVEAHDSLVSAFACTTCTLPL